MGYSLSASERRKILRALLNGLGVRETSKVRNVTVPTIWSILEKVAHSYTAHERMLFERKTNWCFGWVHRTRAVWMGKNLSCTIHLEVDPSTNYVRLDSILPGGDPSTDPFGIKHVDAVLSISPVPTININWVKALCIVGIAYHNYCFGDTPPGVEAGLTAEKWTLVDLLVERSDMPLPEPNDVPRPATEEPISMSTAALELPSPPHQTNESEFGRLRTLTLSQISGLEGEIKELEDQAVLLQHEISQKRNMAALLGSLLKTLQPLVENSRS